MGHFSDVTPDMVGPGVSLLYRYTNGHLTLHLQDGCDVGRQGEKVSCFVQAGNHRGLVFDICYIAECFR